MNDNDIIKMIEYCFDDDAPCEGCSLYDDRFCKTEILKSALDLINRQKAEIENLKAENLELKNGYFQKRYEETEHQELIGLRNAWQKSRMDYIDLNAKWEGKFKTAKTEANKEFAERLKSHKRRMCGNDNGGLYWDQAVLVDDIDRVLKEMTEEQE